MLARLLRWFHGRPTARTHGTELPAGAILLNGGVDYAFEVIGQGSHQTPLEAIYRDCDGEGTERRLIASLASEPGHSYNAHAVAVSIRGWTVAHFSRAEGKRYAQLIAHAARGGMVVCRASIRAVDGAGARKREFRVFLDLASPGRAVPAGTHDED